jgi:predicted amidohydrolase
MEIRAASIQMRIGRSLDENLDDAKRMIEDASSQEADVICLPEYFFASHSLLTKGYSTIYEKTRCFLEDISSDYDLIIAGNVIEPSGGNHFNTCFIYECGKLIGEQRKVHLTKGEEKFGLKNGEELDVFTSKICTLGVLVCADVLYPEACRVLGLKGADVVFNPVVSVYRVNDITKEARPSLFVSRSYDNCYFLLKAGGIGHSPFGKKIVGRSLIAAPWGIIASASDERGEDVVIATLDFELLKKIRDENHSLRRRVRSAYLPLIDI